MINSRKLLIIITGPTAVGKTSFSIELAKLLHTEIISADSRQFYREMKIGTAPPSLQELNDIKHHFIGHLSVHDHYNVSKYESDAVNRINELFRTYDKLIMVGGSGLYINAVIHGIDDLPDPDETTRNYFKLLYANEGIESLRKLLGKSDPEYYAQVDLKNPSRLIRALEVCFTTGKKYSLLRKNEKKQRNFRHIIIGLNRQRNELFEIINRRTDKMIEHGLVKEAAGLCGCEGNRKGRQVNKSYVAAYFFGIAAPR